MGIYRFRSFNKYSLLDIENDTITGSTNDEMNDPYDCHFYFNKDRIIDYLNEENRFLKICQHTKNNNFNSSYDLVDYLSAHLQNAISKSFLTVCLTKNLTKEIMWAHYTNSAKGFVIEYDECTIKDSIKTLKKSTNDPFHRECLELRRINYVNTKTDNTNFVLSYLENSLKFYSLYGYYFLDRCDIPIDGVEMDFTPITLAKNIVYEKSIDWIYEDELRLIIDNQKCDLENSLLTNHEPVLRNIKPRAIYLGEKCSTANKNKILKMAQCKHFDVYKMKPSYDKKCYALDFELVYKA